MADQPIVTDFKSIDDVETYANQATVAEIGKKIALNLQHLLTWHALRVVGAQYEPSPDETVRTPHYRWRILDTLTNSRAQACHLCLLPKTTSGGSAPSWTLNVGASADTDSIAHWKVGGTVNNPQDVVHRRAAQLSVAPSGAETNMTVDSANGARVQSVAVVQHMRLTAPPGWVLDDAVYRLVTLTPYLAGKGIHAQDIGQLVDRVQNDLFPNWRRQQFCWSTRGATSGDAISRTAGTFGNIFDQTISTRSATSPGFQCPARNAGRFGATTIECDVEVYAANTGGATSATVRFASSLGNADVIVNSATAQWWQVAQTLTLDTTIEADRVDVLMAGDGTNPLRVWAVRCQERPL